MNIKMLAPCLCIVAFTACNDAQKHPETDIETARAFIKDILENNYKDAKTLVLDEDINNQYFQLSKSDFEGKSKEEHEKYRDADIIINELKNVNDSVTIVNYSNSYKRDKKNEVKVVRINGQWFVDLKHTFQQGPAAK